MPPVQLLIESSHEDPFGGPSRHHLSSASLPELRLPGHWRTWESLDPRDPCRGRRAGEPRKVLGRPKKRLGPLKGSPPEVEIPKVARESANQESRGPSRGTEERDPRWREKLVAALKKHTSVLDSQG